MKEIEFANSILPVKIINVIFFIAVGLYLYIDRKKIILFLRGNNKGKILLNLQRLISKEKFKSDYDPDFILLKYFKENNDFIKSENPFAWKSANDFLYNIYLKYPKEFINKLEHSIEFKDIEYFEKLEYSKFSKEEIIEKQKIIDIYNILLNKGRTWASKNRKRHLAVRLGYFVIRADFIIPDGDSPENWLLAWNKALKPKRYLTTFALIKNPLDEGERRSKKSNDKAIAEIRKIFFEIEWKLGIKLIEDLY